MSSNYIDGKQHTLNRRREFIREHRIDYRLNV